MRPLKVIEEVVVRRSSVPPSETPSPSPGNLTAKVPVLRGGPGTPVPHRDSDPIGRQPPDGARPTPRPGTTGPPKETVSTPGTAAPQSENEVTTITKADTGARNPRRTAPLSQPLSVQGNHPHATAGEEECRRTTTPQHRSPPRRPPPGSPAPQGEGPPLPPFNSRSERLGNSVAALAQQPPTTAPTPHRSVPRPWQPAPTGRNTPAQGTALGTRTATSPALKGRNKVAQSTALGRNTPIQRISWIPAAANRPATPHWTAVYHFGTRQPRHSSAPTLYGFTQRPTPPAPTGRNTPAQGIALGTRTVTSPALKGRNEVAQGIVLGRNTPIQRVTRNPDREPTGRTSPHIRTPLRDPGNSVAPSPCRSLAPEVVVVPPPVCFSENADHPTLWQPVTARSAITPSTAPANPQPSPPHT